MRLSNLIAPGRAWPRPVRAAVAAVGLLLVPYAVALALLCHPAVQARLRERIVETLRVRFGDRFVLEGDVRVDPLLRVSFGPLVVHGATRGDPPFLRVERVKARARMGALLAGRVEPASVELSRLVVVFMAGGHALELGPVDGDITRERDGTRERIALDLRLPNGSVSIAAEGTAAPDLASAEGHVRVSANGIVLAGERVGSAPVGPIQAEAEGTLSWNGRDRRLSLAGGRVSLLGTIRADAEGAITLDPGHPFVLSLRADGLDFASAVAALPQALAPPYTVPCPAGTLDARAEVAGPLLAPSDWTLSAALDLSRMRATARAAPPVVLRAPFVHRPTATGAAPAIAVGPANPDFVSIADLPVHVVRAITTSEDGGFFGHEGFDFGELRNALAEGAEAGRVVRGGSTITQQLAKNLYLTGEKTLTRKVREAVITIALEATVPKQRLLEIYLNIVEWGPGVWGLGPAARHWFGKDARELTPMEAAFLASIIPNPARYHFMHDRGAMSETWRRRVEDVLLKMTEQGVLGDEDLFRALAEPVVFTPG